MSLSPICFGQRISWLFLIFALLAIGAPAAWAQEGTLLGTVTDPSGAAVPDVSVDITNTDTGQTVALHTNAVGQYVAPNLKIGHYQIHVQAANFQSQEQSQVVVAVGDRRRIDFQLKLGSTQQNVTVEANAVAVQSDSGEQSYVINSQQVTQLSTNGRSMYTLETLTPGASSMQQDFQVPTSAGGDANVSFNGLREGHNLWLIDGGEASDRGGGGGSDVMPSIDSLAEFRTLTSNYSAEYGLSSAGTLTTVVKSGTKALHASGWYFGRNDALDARNFFNPAPNPVAELRFHTFGFNVGGPLSLHPNRSNPKTFFFYNMEWRRLIQGQILNQTVPLASTYPDASGTGTGAIFPTAVKVPTNVVSLGSNCPGGVPPAGIIPGSNFPNNTIPTCMIDANAVSLLNAGIFPKPTSGTQFIGGNNTPTNVREEIVRIDHQFNDKLSVFGHFISDQVSQTFGTTQWSNDNVPTVFNTFGNPSYHAVVHATYTASPTLLNEVAFNYNGNRIHILPAGVVTAPSDFTFNRIFTGPNVDNRIPSISLSGATGANYTSNWQPWNNTANDYQFRDDISWTKGSHQLKFGASFALYTKLQDYFATTQGGFTFDGSFSGNDFADFLLGDAQKYSEFALKTSGQWNSISPAAYIQDNWRATHRLTLNLGLRWDGIPHTYEANNNMSNFYPNLYNPAAAPVFATNPNGTTNFNQISPNSPGLGTSPVAALQGLQFYLNGIGLEGRNGIPKGLVNDTWDAFGPRIGFAFDVTGKGTTILRGGFGTMYERIQGNDMYNAATNSPFDYNLNVNNVLFSNPHLQTAGGGITVPIVVSSIVGLNRSYKVPTSYQYSLGIQQSLGRNTVFSVSYVGNQNRWQSYSQETDLPPMNQLASLAVNKVGTNGVPFNGLVNFPGFASILMNSTGANSNYNSLQVELHGHIYHDLQLQAAYTYSRAIDPTTGGLGGGDSFDLDHVSNPYVGWKYDRGPSPFDRTHVAFVNFVYDIPAFRNSGNALLKHVVGGWEVSGIVTAETGTPLNIGCNSTCGASFQTASNLFPGGDTLMRPNLVGPISYPKQVGSWFSTGAFAAPPPGNWGNLGFDGLRGPGRQNWNISLFKEFVLNETRGSRVEFRAESFNTFNHTQFGGPGQNGGISTNLGATNFGAVTAAWDPRVFQLGLKLIY